MLSFAVEARPDMRTAPRLAWAALGVAVLSLGIAGCSRSAQSYFERGNARLEEGKIDAAVLEYRNAVQKDPKFAAARQKLADVYMRQGNAAGALGEYVRAADLLPNDAAAQVQAGSLLLLARRAEDAKARADKALAVDPKNVEALVLRANALAGLTDLDGALKEMQQALQLDPRSSFQSNLGALQMAKGNLPEAEAAFRQAVETDPKSVAAQVALGQFLWSTGKAADAEGAFKAALGADDTSQLATRAMAAYYLRSNRPAEAEPYLKKTVVLTGSADSRLSLADYYVRMKRPADAIAVLESLSKDARYWALAKAGIADIYHSEGKNAEAYRTADEVIAKHPSLAAARIVRGRLFLADGRLDEALADGQAAVKADPQNVEAHFLLGTVYEGKRDLENAARSLGEVLRLNPRASAAQVRLAMIEMQRNNVQAAIQLVDQVATDQPENVPALLVLARSLVAKGDLTRAAEVTAKLVERAPQSPAVQNQAGMLAMAKGDRAGARAAFEKALALADTMVEPLTGLVTLDLQEKKPAQARARLEARLAKTPDASAVLALAGRTWAATGDPAKSEEYLKRAIAADASNLDAYSVLGSLYLQQQKPDQAVAEFDKMAAKQPGAIGPATLSALILQGQGKEQEAQQRYERLVEANPKAAVAANNLAWMYASRGEQLDRALQLAQAAKAELPENPQVSDTLAFVYLKKDLPSLAVPLLRQAVEKEPSNAAFHYRLGLAYSGTGDKAAARQELERALSLKPDFDSAADARTLLEKLQQ